MARVIHLFRAPKRREAMEELNEVQVREDVTTEGLEVNGLAIGQRLQIGEVELQVSAVCDPCEQIDALRPGLQAEMQGKRGMLCKVLRGGLLRRGDAIVVIERMAAQGI